MLGSGIFKVQKQGALLAVCVAVALCLGACTRTARQAPLLPQPVAIEPLGALAGGLAVPTTGEVAMAPPGARATASATAVAPVEALTSTNVNGNMPPLPPDRTDVTGSIARADGREPQLAVPIRPASVIGPRVETRNIGEEMPLHAVVAAALASHPEIAIATARATEARAGVALARATLFPQIETRFTLGQGTPITPESDVGNVLPGASIASQRAAGVSFRQLIYDFGTARNDILRSRELQEFERHRVIDRMEDVALRTAVAYLRMLEQRETVALADENVSSHDRLGRLVQESQRAGNATVADVGRVQARLVEAQAQRADLASDLQASIDQFRRMTRLEPGRLSRPNLGGRLLPRSVQEALETLDGQHPRLLSIAAMRRSQSNELASQRAQNMPRLGFEVEATQRTFIEPVNRNELDIRSMFVLRHRLADGGARRAQMDQINARMTGTDASFINERDDIEASLRQSYRAIETARSKLDTLIAGERSSRQVRELYLEQFRGGRRTIFELLDAHQSLYQARKALTQNRFEELRALMGGLRATGRLTEVIMTAPQPAQRSASTDRAPQRR